MKSELRPFLKWVGGKRQLLPTLVHYAPKKFGTYFEPFVGAGALFFKLRPDTAVINDLNSELMNCYKVIQNSPEELISSLKEHHNVSDYYYEIRGWDREEDFLSRSDVSRASRTVFLNKTCFNGLYRVNRKGQFNASFGKYSDPKIVEEPLIRSLHTFLSQSNIEILNDDFEQVLSTAKRGDFVYLDPPYDPVDTGKSFTKYQSGGFNRSDQDRLYEAVVRLTHRGVYVMASNAATDYIRTTYKSFNLVSVQASRKINSKVTSRGKVDETLILNYDPNTKELLNIGEY